ncbi:hypothetical protein [Hymenobacter sp. J193]|nr:hypothetical protein [Hymenobacter sp. J193]
MLRLMEALLPASKPARLGLAVLAAYFIYRAGVSTGEFLYYVQH